MNSILGALIGDASGATLEFYGSEITEDVACNAMKMRGGGKLRVGPGQITDDGELTLTLWSTIKDIPVEYGFPAINVIDSYRKWYESIPFDIGRTCSLAFDFDEECANETELLEYKKRVYNLNHLSESNGALMRASAIATWFAKSNLDAYIGAQYAMEDASLSHPNKICQEVNAIYVFTLINLLRGVSTNDAILYTDEFININDFSDKVKKWYFIDSKDITHINTKKNIGHCRWGFVLAFYFLRNSTISYEDAIMMTLMKGGDTDTNATIVGGLVGIYQDIPEYMLYPVLTFDSRINSNYGHNRPIKYCAKYVLDI